MWICSALGNWWARKRVRQVQAAPARDGWGVIAGPLAAAVAGAGAGAATGGIVGALVGWNIPEEHVKRYDEGIRKGGILMGVKPRNDEDAAYFENSWKTNRAQDIYR